jgi:hypothetical protein
VSPRWPVRCLTAALAALALCAGAGELWAQDAQPQPPARPRPPRTPRFEATVGVVHLPGHELGSASAMLTPTLGGSPFTLFVTNTDAAGAPSLDLRLAYLLTPSFNIEGGMVYGKPLVTTRISADVEGTPDVTASETLQQYIFEVGAVFNLRRAAFARGRAVPFVGAGVGHLRHLHQDNQLVETGFTVHTGGGVKLWLTTGRTRMGIRGDLRLYILDGGFTLGDDRRTTAAGGASFIVRF